MSEGKEYIRDGRAPIPAKESTSRTMSSIKGKDTKPELILRKELWHSGIKGYRLHWKKVPGRPDIAFPGKKLGIFVNGCFWHRCPECNLPMPRSNSDFWRNKFEKNIERDNRKIEQLKDLGWKVITIWECQIKRILPEQIKKIKNELL
ncbi:MAG TPA: very short patch repair endonuclease [Edaphocola sp.]|nr:very short patch repair endonuclease [Edaphocola sp.]